MAVARRSTLAAGLAAVWFARRRAPAATEALSPEEEARLAALTRADAASGGIVLRRPILLVEIDPFVEFGERQLDADLGQVQKGVRDQDVVRPPSPARA